MRGLDLKLCYFIIPNRTQIINPHTKRKEIPPKNTYKHIIHNFNSVLKL